MINAENKQAAKQLISLTKELITDHEHHQSELSNLSKKIHLAHNQLWQLSSKRQAHLNYQADFDYYLNKTFRDKPAVIIDKYEALKNEGFEQALAKIAKNPRILGKLVGLGIAGRLLLLINMLRQFIIPKP